MLMLRFKALRIMHHASRFTLYYLVFFFFFIPTAQSSLDITVTGFNGEPLEDVKIQVFPGKIYPDSNVKPIAPPTPREDGLVGFVTNSDGRVSIDLSAGDYTVVAFHHYHPSNFLIMKRVNAPGGLKMSAVDDASPVEIKALREKESRRRGRLLSGAEVFFRPCLASRGSIGLLADGLLNARVTSGNYHVVVSGSFDLHYLVLPNQQIRKEKNNLVIDARELPTAQLKIDLPEKTGLALYEVLETNLTYEYVSAIEEIIGYDAAYTEKYFLALGPGAQPMTLSANIDYNFNMSYLVDVDGAFYAYEIRPETLHVSPERTYEIGNTGDESFALKVNTDKQLYRPGDTVVVNFAIKDTRDNKLNRFFDYSGARLIFPYCTVKNPDGTVIADNSDAEMFEDFFHFSFVLPDSAKAGKYTVKTYMDAIIYGKLEDSKQFTVAPLKDKTPPKISNIDLPSPAEAGSPITITAEISDNATVDQVSLNLANVELPFSREDTLYTFTVSDKLAMPGQFSWVLTAIDYSGNKARQEGKLLVSDSLAPKITPREIQTAEIGQELQFEAEISDNVAVESAKVIYNGKEYELRKNIARVPASQLSFGEFQYTIQAQDSTGNIARTSPKTVNVVDTTPPSIFHTPIELAPYFSAERAGSPVTITALVSDNNQVDKVMLFYRSPGETNFSEINMKAIGDSSYTATVPGSSISSSGLEYRIEATDTSDLSGRRRKAVSPNNADVFSIAGKRIGSVKIVPNFTQDEPLELEVGSVKKFSSVALSQYSEEKIPVNPIWSVTNGLGYIEPDGTLFVSTQCTNQIGRVIATVREIGVDGIPLRAETYVKLKPGPVEKIVLNYQSTVLSAGDERQFYAAVYDAYGNRREDKVFWKVVGDIGSIDKTGKFRAKKVGRGKIKASVDGESSECQVEVTFGELSELVILPKFANLQAGEKKEFIVNGVDEYGNTARLYPAFSVGGGIGKIDSNGIFLATKSGSGFLLATLAGLQSRAQLTVTTGELKKISVDPFIEYVPISTDEKTYKRQFIAFGWDAGGNPVSIQNLRWQTDAAAGKINPNGLFVSTDNPGTPIGNIVINGTVFATGQSKSGRKISQKSVVVIYHKPPKPPSRLAISIENNPPGLSQLSLSAGEEYKLEVVGISPQNQRTAVRPHWRLVGDVGVIRPNGMLQATVVGNGTLIASYASMTAAVDLEVTSGTLHEIVIEPEFLNLEAGESCQLSVFGYDAYSNSVELDRVSYNSGDEGVVDVDANGKIVARKPGVGHVVASVGKISGHAHVFVKPSQQVSKPPLPIKGRHAPTKPSHASRFIYPNPLSIPAGKSQKFIAYKYDADGGMKELTGVTWRVTEGLGRIDRQGVFRAENLGTGYVLMTDRTGYTASAYLEVSEIDSVEREIRQLFIVPDKEISLQVGQQQKFYTLGLEKSGKVRPVLASWTISPPIGQINALGILKASASGEGVLRATYGGLTDICYVEISDKTLSTDYGSGVGLSAEGVSKPLNGLVEEVPEIWCEPRRLAEIRITPSSNETLKLKAGDSLKFNAIGIDVEGKKIAVTPSWSVLSDTNLGTIGTNGLFIANLPGTGEILATVGHISSSVSIEVSENRPVFARLKPDSTVLSNQPVEFIFLAYDRRGNFVNVSPSLIDWQVVGDIGQIDQAGRFVPNLNAKDREGEIIGIVHEYNLLGRSKVFRIDESKIERIEVNPGRVELIPRSRFKFNLAVIDQFGRQFDFSAWKSMIPSVVNVDWKIFRHEPRPEGLRLRGVINSEGEVLIDRSLSTGEKLRVVAELEIPDEKTYTSSATVSVITGPLNRIEIANETSAFSLSVGDKIVLSASGYDAWDNPVQFNPVWHVSPKTIGRLEPDGMDCIFSAEKQGFGTISASQRGITQTVDVVVIPPPIGGLTIISSPAGEIKGGGQTPEERLEISAGTQLPLLTRNDAGEVQALNWKVEPASAGEIKHDVFYPKKAGEARITAEIIGDRAEFFVKIVPGKIADVKISPPVTSVLTKETQEFSVSFYDRWGNQVVQARRLDYMTTGGIGSVDLIREQTLRTYHKDMSLQFKPIHVMVDEVVHGTVDVIADGIHGSASVTVIAKLGKLSSINLMAEPQTVPAGSVSIITLYGADSDGNPFPSIKQPVEFQSPEFGEVRSTSKNERWIYSAPEKLPDQRQISLSAFVETDSGKVSNSVNLRLVPGSLNKLKIESPTTELQSGNDYEFTLTGFDVFGNEVVLEDVNWELSKSIGKLTGKKPDSVTYRAEQSGAVTLIAESDEIQAKTTLTVNPKPPVRLVIEPEKASLSAGSVQEFEITGVDEYGNRNKTISDEIKWEFEEIAGQFERVPSELGKFVFSSSKIGSGSIKLFYELPAGKILTVSAQIKVVSGKLERLELFLLDREARRSPPFELISGGNYKIQAVGFDQYDNKVDIKANWSLSGDIGRFSSEGNEAVIEALYVSEGEVTASSGSVSTSEQVKVVPATRTIGTDGGVIKTPANVSLNIPVDALDREVEVKIAVIHSPGVSHDTERISRVYDLQPRRLILRRPAKLTMEYRDSAIAESGKNLKLYFWDEFSEQWTSAGGTEKNGKVSCFINHFAPYAIMVTDEFTKSAELSIKDLKLTPPVFYAPENNRVTIEYHITNDAKVTIKIFDFRDRLVVRLLDSVYQPAGTNAVRWDGMDGRNELVKNGRYVVVIIAESEDSTTSFSKLLVVFK